MAKRTNKAPAPVGDSDSPDLNPLFQERIRMRAAVKLQSLNVNHFTCGTNSVEVLPGKPAVSQGNYYVVQCIIYVHKDEVRRGE